MGAQPSLKDALVAFRRSFGRERKQNPLINQIRDAFDALEADTLPLTKVVERTTRLTQVLTENVSLLHKARARPTLTFCGSAIAWLYETKLEPAIKSDDKETVSVWEDSLLNGLISPILDICDSEHQDVEIIGEVIYPVICKIMRASHRTAFGGRFARSLALILLETCTLSGNNKNILHDQGIFGASTLSRIILDAKDYHHLDALLELSFKMFSTQNGRLSRAFYAKALFDSDYAATHLPQDVRAEISRIHQVTNDKNSDKHVLDIIRAMSSAHVQRPQIFTTQDLCYCGTNYRQQAPSNVLVLDDSSLCVIICDTDNETDVLASQLTSIDRIELRAQDASRTTIEFTVSEPLQVCSIRESVETPISHTAGSPLRLCVSIASSDVPGLEAALAARNLASKITGDVMLSRRSTALGIKLSQAVSGIELAKTEKPITLQDNVDDMMNKYVNMPSTPDLTLSRTTVVPGAPRKPAEISSHPIESPSKPANIPKLRTTENPMHTPMTQLVPSKERPRRACAVQASKAIQKQVVDDPDSERGATPEQSRRTAPTQDLLGPNDALPTPPDTRRAKPVGKTLVPGSPDLGRTQLESLSSPISVALSPTLKVVSKRKQFDIEDDPIEHPLDTQSHLKEDISNSRPIAPWNTTATRAATKYTANAKKMRVSSPISVSEKHVLVARKSIAMKDTSSDDNKFGVTGGTPTKRMSVAEKTKTKTQLFQLNELTPEKTYAEFKVQNVEGLDGADGEEKQGETKATGRMEESCPPLELPLGPTTVASEMGLASQPVDQPEFIDVETFGARSNMVTEVEQQMLSSQDELLAALAKAAQKAIRFSSPKLGPQECQPTNTTGNVSIPTDMDQANDVGAVDPEFLDSTAYGSQKSVSKRPEAIQLPHMNQGPAPICSEQTIRSDVTLGAPRPLQTLGTLKDKDHMQATQPTGRRVCIKAQQHIANRAVKIPEHGTLRDEPSCKSTQKPCHAASELEQPVARQLDLDLRTSSSSSSSSSSAVSIKSSSNEAIGHTQPFLLVETTSLANAPSAQVSPLEPPPVRMDLCDVDGELYESPNMNIQKLIAKPTFCLKMNEAASLLDPAEANLESSLKATLKASARTKPKHDAFVRVLRSPQPGRKSAFASPQKRKFPGGGRPSVSFIETPTRGRRRLSDLSGISRTDSEDKEDLSSFFVGTSTRTGDAIMEIVHVLNEIQTIIAKNLGDKVKTMAVNARNAETELTRTIIGKLEVSQARTEHHYGVVHRFETSFATQTQGILDSCSRIVKSSTRIDTRVQELLIKNAQVGQQVVNTVVNFELPDIFAARFGSG